MRKAILAAALLAAATPARAEIINLSCDDGGMLLVIDTVKATVTDKNPFQKTAVTVPLIVTAPPSPGAKASPAKAPTTRSTRPPAR